MRSVFWSTVWRLNIEEAGPPRSGTRVNVLLNTKYTFAASMAIGIAPIPTAWTCAASTLKSTSCTGFVPHFGPEADPSFPPLVMLDPPVSMSLLVPELPISAALPTPELLPLPAVPLARPPQAAHAKSASAPGDHRHWLSEGGSRTREFSHQRGSEARSHINKSNGL
jgi:hypothetical protein